MNEKLNNNITKIKDAITYNESVIKDMEKKEKTWIFHDSSLCDSTIYDFQSTFSETLPKLFFSSGFNSQFQEYIENILSKSKNKYLTAIEFGGPGSKLFKGFSIGVFKKTIGICLKDIRTKIEKKIDKKNNHSVISGNIFDKKIFDKIAINKTDLIISRMIGPLDYIDRNPSILYNIFRKWYAFLNENGLMFIQLQYSETGEKKFKDKYKQDFKNTIENWINTIKEKFPQIDIQLGYGIIMGEVIRVHKKTGAPEKLPPI